MRRLLESPVLLFLAFAVPAGLAFVFLIPPLFAADEVFHFERVAVIASGQMMNAPAFAPSGILAFTNKFFAYTYVHSSPPFHYPAGEYRAVMAIPLASGPPVSLPPSLYTAQHPLAYAPQVIAFRLGEALGLPPFMLLYLARLAGLFCSLYLSALALARMPSHRFALCAIMLLPATTFLRSQLSADTLTDALAFLLIADILHEAYRPGKLSTVSLLRLVALAFVQAQCKSGYLLLPLLTLAIPRARFTSPLKRVLALALITLPGIAASVAWLFAVKSTYFSGIHYQTLSGIAYPDAQVEFILHHPFAFLGVILRTLVWPFFVGDLFVGIMGEFGGGVFMPIWACIALWCLLVVAAALDPTARPPGKWLRCVALLLFAALFVLLLTLIYIQWTALQADKVEGFQGRYILPLLPLMLLALPPVQGTLSARRAGACVAVLGALGLGVALFTATAKYFS